MCRISVVHFLIGDTQTNELDTHHSRCGKSNSWNRVPCPVSLHEIVCMPRSNNPPNGSPPWSLSLSQLGSLSIHSLCSELLCVLPLSIPCRYALTGDHSLSFSCTRHSLYISYPFLHSSQASATSRRSKISRPRIQFCGSISKPGTFRVRYEQALILSKPPVAASVFPDTTYTRPRISSSGARFMIMRGEGQVMAESRMTNCKCQKKGREV